MVRWCRDSDRQDLIDDGWIAPHSAHSRGRAIDVGLARSDGQAVEMGSAWDQFDSSSYLRGVEGPALDRRLQLRAEMVRVGFKPYAREWWHFGFDGGADVPVRDVAYACRDR
ncbi:D-alanyl-D-alanine dipeptidase [Enhygromyxa salina]|uniref:D-alanyl-D-alanine dipeptidase n=2 Tax=Enhygromyxa salina TaxID=215803 RepID=A0A2S9XX23_9BACT|nr:D-alanyl-D-alanine dipeptidase [Enhygromyxa salina]